MNRERRRFRRSLNVFAASLSISASLLAGCSDGTPGGSPDQIYFDSLEQSGIDASAWTDQQRDDAITVATQICRDISTKGVQPAAEEFLLGFTVATTNRESLDKAPGMLRAASAGYCPERQDQLASALEVLGY